MELILDQGFQEKQRYRSNFVDLYPCFPVAGGEQGTAEHSKQQIAANSSKHAANNSKQHEKAANGTKNY